MTVLKIDSSARLTGSNSRQLTQYLVDKLGEPVVNRDLIRAPLPLVSAEDLMGVHGSRDDPRISLQEHLALSDTLIKELMAADTLVLGVALYNFTVPAVLKQWVDYICRAGVTFKYGAQGPEGLTGIKRAYIVTATGGTPVGSAMDFGSGYMELICRFIGVKEIFHIDASGSKGAPQEIIDSGQRQIDTLLR